VWFLNEFGSGALVLKHINKQQEEGLSTMHTCRLGVCTCRMVAVGVVAPHEGEMRERAVGRLLEERVESLEVILVPGDTLHHGVRELDGEHERNVREILI